MPETLPTCQKCQYYKVTWDEHKPHGCLFFSFKSHHLPAVEVQLSTGMVCPKFSAKHESAPPRRDPQYSEDGQLMGLVEESEEVKGSLGKILGERGILR